MQTLTGNILVLDDHKSVCRLLKQTFLSVGCNVYTAESTLEALKVIDLQEFDVILSDINLPIFSGMVLLQEIAKRDKDLPVIMITASQDIETTKQALSIGAYDYITKPFDKMQVIFSVSRALQYRKLICENRAYQQSQENIVRTRTRELQMALMRLEDAFLENRKAHLETIIVLSKVAEFNDVDTGNHIKRISRYAELLGKAMKMPSHFLDQLAYSSPMHDIGKLFVNSHILKKPAKLTPEEFAEMKMHPLNGARILEGVQFLQMARDIALCHHEHYDGSGYPSGLKQEQIPISARIVTICDVFDALVSKRCYKEEYSLQTAETIVRQEIGKRFDPEIATIFLSIKDEMYQIYQDLRDNV
jgi:putative two-component system response regulator